MKLNGADEVEPAALMSVSTTVPVSPSFAVNVTGPPMASIGGRAVPLMVTTTWRLVTWSDGTTGERVIVLCHLIAPSVNLELKTNVDDSGLLRLVSRGFVVVHSFISEGRSCPGYRVQTKYYLTLPTQLQHEIPGSE